MTERLENVLKEITELLDFHEEWLLIERDGRSFSVRRAEIELNLENGKLLFGFLNKKGFQTWRLVNWKYEKQKVYFELTRNFGREQRKIELVPRILVAELTDTIELARIKKANKIANLIIKNQRGAKLVRVNLNQETGRFAQIIFENLLRKQIAALADVSDEATPENLLTTAILWLAKLERRKKNPIETVWILAEKKVAEDMQKLLALLKENWKAKINLKEISREGAKGQSEELREVKKLSFTDLWREKPKKIQTIKNFETSETAQKIISFSPKEINVVFTLRGETLWFSGLPFARVRKIFDEEKAWFGIESKRQILSEKTFDEFLELMENLKTYRRFDSPNKFHALYGRAPEAWLEAILRKNIKLLDANLILSPIYNQFRAEKDKIDLLALRRDGRLVIIELKVSCNREMVFQAVGYWRKVELQRRAGNIKKAEIFGDVKISDEPPLIYLVAPTLSFHRDFDFLARTVSSEIEIMRFDLNENWRENLKVIQRRSLKEEFFGHL